MKRTDVHRPGAIIPADYHFAMSYILPGSDPQERWNINLAIAHTHKVCEAEQTNAA